MKLTREMLGGKKCKCKNIPELMEDQTTTTKDKNKQKKKIKGAIKH